VGRDDLCVAILLYAIAALAHFSASRPSPCRGSSSMRFHKIWEYVFVCKGDGGLKCTNTGDGSYTSLYVVLGTGYADTYAIDLSGGFNLPVLVQPVTRNPSYVAGGACNDASCNTDFTVACPSKFQAATNGGSTLACKFDHSLTTWYSVDCPQVVLEKTENFWSCIDTDYQVTFCPSGTKVALSPDAIPSANSSQSVSSSSSTPSPPGTQNSGTSQPVSQNSKTSQSVSSTGGVDQSGTPSPNGNDHPRKLGPGAIAGIAVGGASGFGSVVVLVVFVFRGRYKRRRHVNLIDDEDDKEQNDGHIDPFIGNGEYRVTPFTMPVLKGKDSEKSPESEQITSEETDNMDNATLINHPSSSQGTGHRIDAVIERSAQLRPPAEDINQGENDNTPDLLQLFENRVFENQLIQLISQRMDRGPPPAISRRSSDDGLPEYRSTRS